MAELRGAEIVLSDDGLQHYALQRDIEIAAFDDRGTGNGWLLPAGPLREPWPERKRQGLDLVLHTGQHPAFEGFKSSRQLSEDAWSPNGQKVVLDGLRGRPVTALAGIANPQAFFGMLRDRGLMLEATIALPDHHVYRDADLAGRVNVTFTIGLTGSVLLAKATKDSTLADAEVVSCIERSFYLLSFPRPEGSTVQVTYPLSFEKGT